MKVHEGPLTALNHQELHLLTGFFILFEGQLSAELLTLLHWRFSLPSNHVTYPFTSKETRLPPPSLRPLHPPLVIHPSIRHIRYGGYETSGLLSFPSSFDSGTRF